jgi:gas vesicle protein
LPQAARKPILINKGPHFIRSKRREIMAKLTKQEKFQAKIGIEMDHLKARLIELRAKANEVKLEAKVEYDKTLDTLEKTQADLKTRLEEWTKTGQELAGDMKKTIKRSVKDLKKSIKDAYKSLT